MDTLGDPALPHHPRGDPVAPWATSAHGADPHGRAESGLGVSAVVWAETIIQTLGGTPMGRIPLEVGGGGYRRCRGRGHEGRTIEGSGSSCPGRSGGGQTALERLVAPQAVPLPPFRRRRGSLGNRLGVLRGRVGPRR